MRLIVTRPAAAGREPGWRELRALGVDARGAAADRHRAAATTRRRCSQAWRELPRCALVMFVSANAVAALLRGAARRAAPGRRGVLAGSTGPGTSAALRAAGVPERGAGRAGRRRAALRFRGAVGAAARPRLARPPRARGARRGRARLAGRARCAQHGAEVDFVAAYRRARAAAATRPQRPLLRRGAGAAGGAPVALQQLARRWPTCGALAPAADWSRSAARWPRTRASRSARARRASARCGWWPPAPRRRGRLLGPARAAPIQSAAQ